ncbi:protein of unknown function [Taphrina deformans PYCC 5710]|uniref:Ribonuclease H2 subunit B n=1 Tax=Taphrina deformans (strain PYCC 5710 / ATCC 11124 / CBS 356.35 / IMI 108563 / JCM 9778 / NBRC 8474) TaxID=1097556 RepID=R4XBI7_TAPDE|nr:protein of unknown function [Taphrina deformans PYCC 5710]|eukprot:CCG82955.1 protein of unknown function [Taphrina deformans PYCC 5710]
MSIVLVAPTNAKDIILLDHPRTGTPAQFLLSESNNIFEIITLAQKHKRSLLCEASIISDAPVHVATAFDPAFLLIAQLYKSANSDRFVERDELLVGFPTRLRSCLERSLVDVCDILDGAVSMEDPFWRFSRARTDSYLQAKVAHVQTLLPATIIDSLPGHEDILVLAKQKAALELVSNYLAPSMATELARAFDFSTLDVYLNSQKSDFVNPNEFIKRKNEDDEQSATTTAKKQKKGSKGVESLKKVNTKGMKSMTSFFTKKAK